MLSACLETFCKLSDNVSKVIEKIVYESAEFCLILQVQYRWKIIENMKRSDVHFVLKENTKHVIIVFYRSVFAMA